MNRQTVWGQIGPLLGAFGPAAGSSPVDSVERCCVVVGNDDGLGGLRGGSHPFSKVLCFFKAFS
jgi:hypothetical protein